MNESKVLKLQIKQKYMEKNLNDCAQDCVHHRRASSHILLTPYPLQLKGCCASATPLIIEILKCGRLSVYKDPHFDAKLFSVETV